ncbi:ROK-family transcriptional regulator [Microbacterium esteraromaticum]|uniref:ROK-family transcriptional regulator n=1 Tax=Microbacterium esteraromaticum TaxID=57043 RepID=A0A1R4KHR4_9MICO|nr:ROK family protein [Microbacterium esteraromaticum]SJN43850.1 ROK-family transcriptional regulator [Microbacterium esteraromaticum]
MGKDESGPWAARRSPTIRSLRAQNRSAALTHLITAGRATRAEIAAAAGLSSASATNITGDLMAEGLIAETGVLASQGGRPSSVLEPVADGAYFIGADVGERGVAVEMFDLSMTRIDREFRGGDTEESPDAIGRDLTDAVEALRQRNGGRWSRVVGVGLGLPGIVETDADGGQTLYAESLGWEPVAVRPMLGHDLPLFGENGAKTLAKAERWFGAARGVDHAVVALLGRGVGLGVISGGELVRGSASAATEWGHVCLDRSGPVCRCGRRGCVEAFLGAQGILDRWASAGGRFEGSGWNAMGELLDATEAGDPIASALLDETIDVLGSALGGLVNLFNPQRVIIGGWVGMRLMERFSSRIDEAIHHAALARPAGQFELRSCTYGGDAVALGAAIMPLESLIAAPIEETVSRAARVG